MIPERIDLFERDAARATTGNVGYIDLFWSGVVIGEAKSLGADLTAAHGQALDYLAGGSIDQHEWPKFAMVTDFENMHLTKLGDDSWTVEFTIDNIADHLDQLMFLAGYEVVTKKEEQEASIVASRLMADLFNTMLGDEVDEGVGEDAPTNPEDEDERVQRTSMWMTRLLFLMFGDDAGLWEEDLFYRFVLYDTTPANLGSQLNGLFQVLNTPDSQRRRVPESMEKFPYVNGSVFEDSLPPEFFNEHMRNALLAACRFHWTRISPAVFGAMFQLVKSKEARRADGEHYTSEKNIMKVIEPLFLDELRDEAGRLIRNKTTTAADLRRFRDSLSEMVFCDPACGCGNFLVVAYRELRRIETDIIVALREKEGISTASLDVSLDQKLRISQFHGFELNWWPAKIAETAMFLVDHQANRELARRVGDAPERLPINITAHIVHGNALHLEWEKEMPATDGMTYVFGNPPFIGQKEKAKDPQKVQDMKAVWGKDYDGYLDYVTAWIARSAQFLAERRGEFAFVTTNSITQGQPVPALFDPLIREGWRIKFAHRTFSWDSEAPGKAAVHCVIVGFTRDRGVKQRLWDYAQVNGDAQEISVHTGINPYLIDGPHVLIRKRMKLLSPSLPPVQSGSKAVDWGHYTIEDADEFRRLKKDPTLSKYLRLYLGGEELINRVDRWCLWLENLDPQDLQHSPELRRRIEDVRDLRNKSPRAGTLKAADTPHLFGEDRQPPGNYLGIPQTFSQSRRYATVARLDGQVIASIKLFTAADPDGYLFAVLSSSMFLAWQMAVGGRIKSDPSFSNTVVWNNFPLPEVDDKTRAAIIKAGAGVLAARALHPERSLADHYQPLGMDRELVKAHDALDRVVDVALGAPRKLTTEEQRLEVLFARYAEMTRD